jgi:hypothetical protein
LKKSLVIFFLLFVIFFSQITHSQDKEKVGSPPTFNQIGGLYNFGDKDKVNIEVSIWGYVKLPGKYVIPEGSTFVDLISYAGGPSPEANLDDIRLFRPKNDTLKVTKDELIKLDYNDLFWEKEIKSGVNRNVVIKPGDVIIFPGSPRYFFRDNLTLILSITSTMLSIALIIITTANK